MNVSVTGPFIYFTIPIFGGIPVTQTAVSCAVVTILLCTAFILLGRDLKKRPGGKQVLVEKGLLHSFLFSLFYGTILEKEDCVLMKPDIEKLREKYINNPP